MNRKPVIAFLCIQNSCRSQLSEAFGRHLAAETFTIDIDPRMPDMGNAPGGNFAPSGSEGGSRTPGSGSRGN